MVWETDRITLRNYWSYEYISKSDHAFLVTPGGLRIASMTRARARGIAAALNTPQGSDAFISARNMEEE